MRAWASATWVNWYVEATSPAAIDARVAGAQAVVHLDALLAVAHARRFEPQALDVRRAPGRDQDLVGRDLARARRRALEDHVFSRPAAPHLERS